MSTVVQILLVIPCVLSCITTAIYAYIAYQNFKRPKDEIWETALKIAVSNGNSVDAHQFAQLYEQLKFFKEHGCTLNGKHLVQLMQDSQLQSARSQLSDIES